MGLDVWHLMAALLGVALLSGCATAVAEQAAQQHHLSVSRAGAARQPGAALVSMHTVVPSSCTREADWEVMGLYYSFLRCAAPTSLRPGPLLPRSHVQWGVTVTGSSAGCNAPGSVSRLRLAQASRAEHGRRRFCAGPSSRA